MWRRVLVIVLLCKLLFVTPMIVMPRMFPTSHWADVQRKCGCTISGVVVHLLSDSSATVYLVIVVALGVSWKSANFES